VRRLYDDNLYRFDLPQQSYWEATAGPQSFDARSLESDESCDVAIIGGGYTGLSAALHLARDYSMDVRVIEAGHIGWGASGRNGGFCCIGGTGIHRGNLVRHVGLARAREWYQAMAAAVLFVRDLARDEAIDCEVCGEAEIEIAHSPRAFAGLQADYGVLTGQLGLDAELLGAAESRERIYDSTEQYGALITRPAFGMHPLRYCRGLAAAACRRGATLHAHSEVVAWTRDRDGRHRLHTRGGSLRAKTVIFATNGFMPERLRREFSGRPLPVLRAIFVPRPLPEAAISRQGWRTRHPAINSRHILNYFRLLPDGRFLFGARGHTRGTPRGERSTYDKMLRTFQRVWPAWRGIDVEYRWHGLICMTGSLRPGIGHLAEEPGVFFGFGYHGNGVNTATWAGRQLADWIGRGRPAPDLPAIVRGLPRRYPLPVLRRTYLRTGLAIANWLDSR